MLPNSHFLPLAGPSRVSRMNRWTLGGELQTWCRRLTIASDIMFTNKLFSRFFDNGQVIETIRGGGIFQPAVDHAIKLLQDGEWVGPRSRVDGRSWADSHLSRRQDQSANHQPGGRPDTFQVGRVSCDEQYRQLAAQADPSVDASVWTRRSCPRSFPSGYPVSFA